MLGNGMVNVFTDESKLIRYPENYALQVEGWVNCFGKQFL